MRYSSAVVLSTIVVGQAAAANLHNRHASFHARRQADAKRSADTVDWSKVAYDLSDVDWSSVFATPAATAAAATTVAQVKAAEATVDAYTAEAPTTSSSEEATSTSAQAAATTSSDSESLGDAIGDLVSDLMYGVEEIASALGINTGTNSNSSDAGIWIGDDGDWKAEFTNSHSADTVLYCWKADGYSGMILTDSKPAISVGIKSGESVVISFADNVPSACAPAYSTTKLANFGGLSQTWWEVTFGEYGTFDVSREVNMDGNTISSVGSICTSDMDTCVFKCKDSSVSSCEDGDSYDLYNCDSSSGGGGGYDKTAGGTGGGCSMGSSGETVKVTFS